MPTLYNGILANSSPVSSVNISSSTNATPIQITTSTPHGLMNQDLVHVTGHFVNTKANGYWSILVTGSTTFTLTGSIGNNVGGANGIVQLISRGAATNIWSDGDAFTAAALNLQVIPPLDRTSELFAATGAYKFSAQGTFGTSIAGTAQGVSISDAIPPAMWAINNGNSASLVQMNDASADPASWILGGIKTTDLVEITLETSAQVLGTGASTYTGSFALGYALTPWISAGFYTAGLSSPSFGGSKVLTTQGSSETAIAPLTLKLYLSNFAFSDGSQEGMVYIAPFCNNNNSSSETLKLVGDHHLSYRIWRPTGWPQ